jgi:hypothetical protein
MDTLTSPTFTCVNELAAFPPKNPSYDMKVTNDF